MGELADRLDRVVVREVSPDGGIAATLARGSQVELRFRPGAYRRYREPVLEGQLAELAREVRASCQRTFYWTVSEVTGRSVTAELAERELDGRDRRFHQAQRAVRAGGVSPGAWITAETQGLDHWRIRLKTGALRALSEQEFIAEATATVDRVLGAYRGHDRELRDEFFDLKLPQGGRNG